MPFERWLYALPDSIAMPKSFAILSISGAVFVLALSPRMMRGAEKRAIQSSLIACAVAAAVNFFSGVASNQPVAASIITNMPL